MRPRARCLRALADALAGLKATLAEERPTIATRVANKRVIGAIADALPSLIGGSADLTGSNGTKSDELAPITPGDYGGRYLYYGVREHAMGAVMNGMALHGGVIPFGGTFLTFTDYCRPAIRLSALMELRVIYVMTHDSIGLGEDGPTHQPIEHLASLRAMPNLLLFRPADAIETAECWELASGQRRAPVGARADTAGGALSAGWRERRFRQRGARAAATCCARRRRERPRSCCSPQGRRCAIADEARQTLEADGVPTRLVSLPSLGAVRRAGARLIASSVLGGADAIRVAVEAASPLGWERYVGACGTVVGMRSFGGSAPAKDLYAHFGITAEAVVTAVKARL